jgi:hypothetical protein
MSEWGECECKRDRTDLAVEMSCHHSSYLDREQSRLSDIPAAARLPVARTVLSCTVVLFLLKLTLFFYERSLQSVKTNVTS